VPDMPEDERSPEVIGCYRLGDDPSALDATPSLTVVQANAKDADRRIVSSMLEMTTLQFADGNQTHQLSYHLTANGGDAVELTIPNGLSITSARVNNRPAAIDVSDEAPNRATIQLPKSQRLAALTIDLHAQVAPLGFRAKISPPIVGTTFPIMRGTWTVLSPPGYEEAGAFDAAKPGVLQRLFGPLARGSANGAHRIGVRAAYGAGDVPATLAGGEQRRSTSTAAAPSGWRPATQEFITEPMPIRLRLIDGVDATWYVVGLVSAVAAAWLWPRRRRWVTIAAMIAAICCLTLSAASIVAAQAVFLGILAGVFARRVAAATPTASRAELRTPAAAGVGLAIMLAAGGLGAEAAETRPVPPSVLYPIDADGKAVGSDVYVPEALVSKLLPSARAARYDGATAALLGAQYEINLSKDQPGGGQVCEKCTLRYRWRTFQPGARIELPLVRGEAAWLAENHTLNGKKVQLTWSASGRGCSLRLDQPGEHELKLELTPRRRTLGDRGQLRLHVLPLPGAIVEINHPAGVEELEIGGAAPLAAGTTRTTARIPGVDVLEASWPIRVRGEAARVSLDQLTWLDVDPATSRLEVRLRLTGDSASVDRLELAVSPQLKLLPLPEDSPIQHLPTAADSPATVELKFRSPPQLPLVLSLPFELQRSVSVGRIDYPSVRVLNAETNSHHFAVSAGSRLRVRDEGASGMTPVTTKEIDQTRGAGPAAAVLQYAMTTAEPTWSLNVERMPDRFAARESLELLCTAADAHVAYAAAIDDVEGEVLVHRLGIPTQLKIKDVSVTGESPTERTPIRWSRPRPDQLWMFLGRPLSQSHTIHISARADYAGDRRLAIPRIGLATSGASTTAVRIRRSSDVLVEWPEGAEPPAGAAPPIATEDVDGLLVGQYSISRRAAPELKVRSNEPRFSADAVLTMDLARVEPVAACVVQGQVTRGVVDGVRLLTDTAWTGPFTVASGGDVEINKAAEAGRQMIEVRLAKPAVAGETFVLRLTGPIALQNDQRIRFPTLHLVDALDERLFLVLPRHAGNQAPQWTLQGLRRAELPEPLSQALGQSSRGSVYRVERERFVAEQRVFPAGILRAQVRLAEIRVTVDRGGLWSAVAQLIVQPGGASPLSVRPPAGAALVHAEVDGRPVIDSSPSDDGWELPAGSRYLPRVVTVGYRSRDGKGDRDLFVATPHIMADGRRLPVSKSLWQIEADGPLSLEATGAARPLSRFEFQSAARRNQIAAVVDASPLAFQLHPWELHQWFEPWLARLGPAADSAAVAEDSQEAAWNQLRERLTDLTATRFTPQTSASPGERRAQDLAVTARFYEGRGDGIALTARPGSDAARWLAALALAVVTGLAWRYPTKLEPLLSAARRRPYAVGAMAGVYWWFALSPSLLGPVIIAASIVGFYKHRQESEPRRHNEHDENNTAVGSS